MQEALVRLDHILFFMINGLHHPLSDRFFLLITQLGNGWVVTPLLFITVFLKSPKRKFGRIILCGALGLSLCGCVNSLIKDSTGRLRPGLVFGYENSENDAAQDNICKGRVHLVGTDYNNRSFPSGHTNTAFAAATFLSTLYGGWFYLSFVAALLVGYSRIYVGVHFPLDVVAGAITGFAVMRVFMFLFDLIADFLERRHLNG